MAQKLERSVTIPENMLEGELTIPSGAQAIVLFAHGSGSSRFSQRNQYVAHVFNDAGIATLLVDLLTADEKKIDENTRHLRFDIDLLSRRLISITSWLLEQSDTSTLSIGYFGSSTGAAAALTSAAKMSGVVKTIVCSGGRPDLASSVLKKVTAPVLLIVGGKDSPVITLNMDAIDDLSGAETKELAVIPGAGHLFDEEGRMEQMAKLALEWFECHLLRNGKEFENKYSQKSSWLSSIFRERPQFQLRFKGRIAAGDVLSASLNKYKDVKNTVVIGIPRGGVAVADRIARKLGAELDIVITTRLRAPNDPEAAIGAIAEGVSVYIDRERLKSMNASDEYVEVEKIRQKKEIERRKMVYGMGPRAYDLQGKTLILADDGAATGSTLIAAARWIKARHPRKLVVAVPVASSGAMKALRNEIDELVVIRHPANFRTVEQYYRDFSPVTDSQIVNILARFAGSRKEC